MTACAGEVLITIRAMAASAVSMATTKRVFRTVRTDMTKPYPRSCRARPPVGMG